MSIVRQPVARRRRLGVPEEARIDAGIAEREGLAVDAHRAVLQRADDVVGRVHEHAQVCRPCSMPMRSAAAMNTSSGALPAPAPMPARDASTRSQPSCTATMELATPSDRLWCACMPVSVCGLSTALNARKRSRTSSIESAPPESTT